MEYRGRNVRIIVSHLSIEPEFVSAQLLDAQVAAEAARLRAKHGGTVHRVTAIVTAIERL